MNSLVFEGTDYSGKSTVVARAIEYLNDKFKNHPNPCMMIKKVVHARHPGATVLGQKIRHIVKYDKDVCLDPLTEQILMLADNSCFTNTILKPELKLGNVVVSDRSNFISGVIYGYAGGVDINRLIQLYVMLDAPKIDMLWVLYCPWEVIKERMLLNRDDAKCKIEGRGGDYLKRVNEAYHELTNVDSKLFKHALLCCKKIVVVDASRSKDEVWEQVKSGIDGIYEDDSGLSKS